MIRESDPCPNCQRIGYFKWILPDARGIECGYVCDAPGCVEKKKSKYRPEIFEDSQYSADEPIEPEDYY